MTKLCISNPVFASPGAAFRCYPPPTHLICLTVCYLASWCRDHLTMRGIGCPAQRPVQNVHAASAEAWTHNPRTSPDLPELHAGQVISCFALRLRQPPGLHVRVRVKKKPKKLSCQDKVLRNSGIHLDKKGTAVFSFSLTLFLLIFG